MVTFELQDPSATANDCLVTVKSNDTNPPISGNESTMVYTGTFDPASPITQSDAISINLKTA